MRFLPWLCALGMLPYAQSDDWPYPGVREVFSPSRTYFVRVVPGKSLGDTVGFKGASKGSYAEAQFYRLEKRPVLSSDGYYQVAQSDCSGRLSCHRRRIPHHAGQLAQPGIREGCGVVRAGRQADPVVRTLLLV